MRKLALLLAFAGPPLISVERLLYSYGVPEILPYPYLALCLPALIFGLFDWKHSRAFAHSVPLAACVALAAISLLWVDPTERGRGALVVANIATAIPISVSVIRLRAYRLCASAFIAASFVSLCVMAWNTDGLGGRLGDLTIDELEFASNPNAFGGLMAAAAILTVALFIVDRGPSQRAGRALFTSRGLAVAIAGIFYIATLTSASRGSIACLGLVTLILVFGQGTSPSRVMGGLVVLFAVASLVSFSAEFADPAIERFSDGEGVATFGGRLAIWTSAAEAFWDAPWTGVGMGGVEKTLAEHYPYGDGVVLGEDGVRRKASHNSYVEWIMATGLLGIFPAAWLVSAMARRAMLIDRKCVTIYRRALLAYCCIFSISTAVYRLPYWIPVAALLFAALTSPKTARAATSAAEHLRRRQPAQLIPPMKRGVAVTP